MLRELGRSWLKSGKRKGREETRGTIKVVGEKAELREGERASCESA